jgi:hypothetical protein
MSDNIDARPRQGFSEDREAASQRTRRRLRSHCPEGFDERIQILSVINRPLSRIYTGTCDGTVTERDIAALFGHPQWGCRAISVGEGKFSVIRHLD